MNDTFDEVVISQDNIRPLQSFVDTLSSETQNALTKFKIKIDELLLDPNNKIDFDTIQNKITSILNTVPTRFVNNGVENAERENEGSLRILSIALLFQLTDDNALRLFWEHWESVQENPEGNDHQNIRQLNEYWLWGVKIHWLPFSEKES